MSRRSPKKHSVFWGLLVGIVLVNLALHSGFGALGLALDPLRWVLLLSAAMVGAWNFLRGPVSPIGQVGGSILVFIGLAGVTVPISQIMLLSILKWGALVVQVIVLVCFSVHLFSIVQWERLFAALFVLTSTVVALAFSIYLLGYNPFWGHPVWYHGRLAAISNPNSIAVVAALNGIVALWMRERYRNGGGKRRVVVGLLVVSLIVLGLTGSRTSAGAFIAGVLVWGWATRNMKWFFLLFGTLLVVFVVSEGYFYDLTGQFRLSDPTNSREGVWEASYASWLQRPWFGYGYGITGQQYTVTSLASAVGSVRDAAGYLGLLESVGMVGACGLLVVYGTVLRHVWNVAQLWRQGVRSRELWVALTSGTVFATLIVHAGGEAWIIAPGGFPHVLMWLSVGGLVYGVLALEKTTRRREEPKHNQIKETRT